MASGFLHLEIRKWKRDFGFPFNYWIAIKLPLSLNEGLFKILKLKKGGNPRPENDCVTI
jgi:hypothetical protein